MTKPARIRGHTGGKVDIFAGVSTVEMAELRQLGDDSEANVITESLQTKELLKASRLETELAELKSKHEAEIKALIRYDMLVLVISNN